MISASEAKRKSFFNLECKEYFDNLEKNINVAIKNGKMSATLGIELTDSKVDSLYIRNAIVQELEELGYKVEFQFSKEKPMKCPYDQWTPTGYIKVSWE